MDLDKLAADLAGKPFSVLAVTDTPSALLTGNKQPSVTVDEVADYRGDLAAAVRETYPAGIHAALHFAGDAPNWRRLLPPTDGWHPPSACAPSSSTATT
jgi:hypothetical protein